MRSSPSRWLVLAVLAMALVSCGDGSGVTEVRSGGSPAPDASGAPDPAASPVDGLTPTQLREAVTEPAPSGRRSAAAPVADRVVLSDGTALWRVRVPGDFTARAARVSVSVGDRVVGQGVLSADLSALVAVSADGSGLDPGQPVSYRWEGSPSVAAGKLVVVR